MRREVKTYEWVCDRCGVVEEVRAFAPEYPSRTTGSWPLPPGWRDEYNPNPPMKRMESGGNYIYQATIKHLCGGCS